MQKRWYQIQNTASQFGFTLAKVVCLSTCPGLPAGAPKVAEVALRNRGAANKHATSIAIQLTIMTSFHRPMTPMYLSVKLMTNSTPKGLGLGWTGAGWLGAGLAAGHWPLAWTLEIFLFFGVKFSIIVASKPHTLPTPKTIPILGR